MRIPSDQLFVARANAARPGFSLTDRNGQSIARICQRLDGLPLAIELAAARVPVLQPEDLLTRLERRLPLLTGGSRDASARQQTMRDTISWSHGLLTPTEQVLFRRLGIFAGGFSLEAAEVIIGWGEHSDLSTMEGIASLASQSLLDQHEAPTAHARFIMLETMREDAMERLAVTGEQEELCQRHAAYFLSLSEMRGQGVPQQSWLEQIELEHDNLRAVLEWSVGRGDRDTAQRLVAALWIYFWAIRGYGSEGRIWADRVRALGPGTSPRLYVEVLFAAGEFAAHFNDVKQATALAKEAHAVAEASGDDLLMGMALHHLAKAVSNRPDPGIGGAETLYGQSLVLLANAVTIDERRTAAVVTHNLAVEAARRGDLAQAEALAAEALARWRELGSNWGTAGTLLMLADTARERGHRHEAMALGQQAVALSWDLR
ncbi:MAG: tetratricopeptide repeat protein, partial [Thermomicrobiales bacterium]